jgi:hypothetical protein
MASYATDSSGSIEYRRLMDDCCEGDPHFLTIADTATELAKTATSRAPANVSGAIGKFKRVIDGFSQKSKGEIDPKDVMLGMFLRVDKSANSAILGHIGEISFRKVLKTIGVTLSDEEIRELMVWFDSDGSKSMDYNEFVRQVYGSDLMTRTITLPAISLHRSKASPEQMRTSGIIPVGELVEPSDKNMKVFKSRARKRHEKELRKKAIAAEKAIILNKLKSIDAQKSIILEHQRFKSLDSSKHK